ncbi:ABC transporter ATP-binding protein [Paraburkholderia hospita]|jgi:multiple sugar transport system ATP-binding protein|uniref:ABC transporter ATP-binding protein n=1 Tax=Paraburkholderia TaxID=1822464 RepID=UPI00027193BE|nr:sn-glycerol-3-phosphate ABC transporter ATP-binding protein UgpC [Paraburkholderia hospita]EUC16395.1 Glycerol-3-phosphate-transporting ATPase [Burkholderia sp. BT03]OUL83069.1 ABC transporter ATP-binding protein [Paraburkholderia hospita]SKC79772.1 carbohydrate ABC transporter ATP-binding protein, CUT1 family [Paraburkholderia hospita]
MAAVQLSGIYKRYGDTQVVHGIDLHIDDGEFVVLVGPSGCGKSTLMRMVAGLEEISGGDLMIGGTRANGLAPQQRNISMVFQSYALYPHLSVYDNIAFGPRIRKEASTSFKPRIEAAAKMLNLSGYLDRLPRALSGGQRQRVAMGRAVVREPSLFLFDEPLSNLDAKLRVQMRTEIKALHQRLKNTVIYVTHDQIEAMTMADRIVVMNAGRIEQIGRPLELYDRPANLFVASFLGSPSMNFAAGEVVSAPNGAALKLADGALIPLAGTSQAVAKPGAKVTLGVRPEHIEASNEGIPMDVEVVEPTGAETHLYGKIGGAAWCVTMRQRASIEPGQRVTVRFPEQHTHLFDTESGNRLG